MENTNATPGGEVLNPQGSEAGTSMNGDIQNNGADKSSVEMRYKEAQNALSQKGDEIKAYSNSLAKLIRKDATYIREIESEKLREDLAQGVLGMSYADWEDQQALETMKGTKEYSTQKEILELKQRLSAKEKKERTSAEHKFFNDKGIMVNQLDSNYLKVQQELSKLNKDYVSDNYEEALATAYSLAFPGGSAPSMMDVNLSRQMSMQRTVGGGTGAGNNVKTLTEGEAKFLAGIGAKKTLEKFKIN